MWSVRILALLLTMAACAAPLQGQLLASASGLQTARGSTVALSDTALLVKAEQFVRAFLAEHLEEATADFDSALSARTSPERLRMIRNSIFGSLGSFREQGEAQRAMEDTTRTVLIPLAFER